MNIIATVCLSLAPRLPPKPAEPTMLPKHSYQNLPDKNKGYHYHSLSIISLRKTCKGLLKLFFCHGRARWSYLARSGYRLCPEVYRSCFGVFSHIINPLLNKLAWSKWLDIGLVLFFACLWTEMKLNTQKKRPRPISSHLDLTLGQQPIHLQSASDTK